MQDNPVQTLGYLARESFKRLFADEAVPLAGNIAFRALFSLFPFLIFLTALAGFFGTAEQAKTAIAFLLSIAPESLVRPLEQEIVSILTVPRADLLSIAALLTIWSAMAGVDSVRVGLNRAYDLRDTRPGWLIYLLDILFVIASAVLLLGFSFLMVLLPLAQRFADSHGIDLIGDFAALENARYALALLLLTVGLLAAHLALPSKRMPILRLLPGVVLTLVIWIVLSLLFSAWLFRFDTFSATYASLSGLFGTMFFVYLAALVLILGGEFNRVLQLWFERGETLS